MAPNSTFQNAKTPEAQNVTSTNVTPGKATSDHSSWPYLRRLNTTVQSAIAAQDSNASSRHVKATWNVAEMVSIGKQILREISRASLDPHFDVAAHWKVECVEACSSASFEQAFR